MVTEKLQSKMIAEWHSQAKEVARFVLNAKGNLAAKVSLLAAHSLYFVIVEYAKLVGAVNLTMG